MVSLFSTLFLLLAPWPAAAGEAMVLQLGGMSGLRARVAVQRKAECLEHVTRVLQPMALIRQGIQAVAEMNQQQASSSSCLDELDRTLAPELADINRRSSGYPDLDELSQAIDKALSETQALERCSESTGPLPAPDCPRLVSPNEIAQSQKKAEGIRARLREAYDELGILARAYQAVAPFPPRSAEYVSLRMRVEGCTVEVELGSAELAAHAANLGPDHRAYCQDKWVTPSEKPALMARLAELQALDSQVAAEWTKRYPPITPMQQTYLSQLPGLLEPPERARLARLVQKAACHNPYPSGSGSHIDWPKAMGSICQGKMVDEATAAAAREKLRRELPTDEKIEQLLAKASEARSATMDQARVRAQSQLENSLPALRLRLLTSRFHHAAHRSGGVVDADKFCADYEAAQNEDLQTHQMDLPLLVPQRESHWQALRNFGLTLGEFSAVEDYTGARYSAINRALFGSTADRSESDSRYADFLNRALERLPAYRSAVSRVALLPPQVLATHQPGAIVTYPAFTSTSRRADWNWSGSHHFVIYGANGRMVEQISRSPGEEEVLFPSGTRFKVLSREEKPDGQVHFVMAEVDANGQVIGHPPSR